MATKFKIKKGDTVQVIAGADKGQSGRVLMVDREKSRVLVEGINVRSVHSKPNTAAPEGGIIKKELPIHISNVALVAGGSPTRIGRKLDEKTGKLVRFAKKTGDTIK